MAGFTPSGRIASITYRGSVTDEIMELAGAFPPVTHEDWLAAVDKVLEGRSFDDVLRSTTADGITIEPLYTREDERAVDQVPGPVATRRASTVAGLTGGWDVRQPHGGTDIAATNAAILTDLARGVTSIDLDMAGIADLATLDAVLDGVLLDLAPVGLHAADDGVAAARLLLDLAVRREVAPSERHVDLGCDPIGRLAVHGAVGGGIDAALASVGALAAEIAPTHPGARTVRADGVPFADAGATPATELAAAVAAGLEYLRALTAAGLDTREAMAQVLLSVTVGADQFGDIAKLRALRVMWARVGEVVGVDDHPTVIQASTASSIATRHDPWVNMLRVTIGCLAAAVGGADIVRVLPFDAAVGVPDELGRRVARNTQLALMEESNLHRVIDPAGGSWYVEHLTDALAAEAWTILQAIEADGGIVAALRSGTLQDRIDASWAQTAASVATRRRPITGVSEFPDVAEKLLERAAAPPVADPDGPAEARPLPLRRIAEPYERLRDAAAGADPSPTVFLANLGPAAVHTARASWAKNFFEAGGIRAVPTDGFDDVESLAAAFAADASAIAVICSSDKTYAEHAAAAATALKAAGAVRVYLAGHPGDRRDADVAAGVDEFIHVGTDVLATLTAAHATLGISEAAS